MRRSIELVTLIVALLSLGACHDVTRRDASSPFDVVARASRPALVPFGSERELRQFLRELAAAQRERDDARQHAAGAKASCVPATCQTLGCGVHPNGCGGTVDCGPCSGKSYDFSDESVAAPAPAAESVTNVQHAGVDEGSIVKLRGDHLIVLRRGRLFSIDIGGGRLSPVSSVDAFGPDVDPSGTWYDEMLVSANTVVVIGYSYERGGTEIGLFHLDGAGKLAYRATHHLRSNDYYSSRNYASRLIGDELVFYTPLALAVTGRDLFGSFPAQRRWRKGGADRPFARIARAQDVYRPLAPSTELWQHTVTTCDLRSSELACRSTVVLGPPGRVFYVSPRSVYVWVVPAGEDDAVVYRMPLDGSAPSALRAAGSPTDQFSFLEEEAHLNVLLRAAASGEGMWGSELSGGEVWLLRVPLSGFSDRVERASASSYTPLPKPLGHTFQNRFVADWVLYGTGNGWGRPELPDRAAVFAHRFARRGKALRLPLGHGVDRIEALGKDAVVIGSDGKDLHFSPVALGHRPWVAPRYTRKQASQGELRSHGFFYRSDGPRTGLLGLPIREAGRPGYEHLFHESASVLFVQNRALSLSELGTLAAEPEGAADDGCRASCVDWYGNARPLFVRGRLFALLGYELVEGELRKSRIVETRRVSFAPRTRPRGGS